MGKGPIKLGGKTTVFDNSPRSFTFRARNIHSSKEIISFFLGDSFFKENWVRLGASTKSRDGLGPLFNTKSCSTCHFMDGRGRPPVGTNEISLSLIMRLSIAGKNKNGGPKADPVYGNQLQNQAILGFLEEGSFFINYEYVYGNYTNGDEYILKKPIYTIGTYGYGKPSQKLLTSPRIAPQMIGMGLLEAVSEDVLIKLSDENDFDGDGVSGKPNYVWDHIKNKKTIGRFGWKANKASVKEQVAAAFINDIGITSSIFPNENHWFPKKISGRKKEIDLSERQLESTTFYAQTLAVPARRNVKNRSVRKGRKLFKKAKCTACHVETLKTGIHSIKALSKQTIHPYTDLLLHDMGDLLSDGREDFEATGHEWRTPPLWGIGLIKTVNKHTRYLHDGRAFSLEEAILWHGGEGEKSKQMFLKFSKKERKNMIDFLKSL